MFVTKTVHDYLNRVRLGPGLMEETQVLDFLFLSYIDTGMPVHIS